MPLTCAVGSVTRYDSPAPWPLVMRTKTPLLAEPGVMRTEVPDTRAEIWSICKQNSHQYGGAGRSTTPTDAFGLQPASRTSSIKRGDRGVMGDLFRLCISRVNDAKKGPV